MKHPLKSILRYMVVVIVLGACRCSASITNVMQFANTSTIPVNDAPSPASVSSIVVSGLTARNGVNEARITQVTLSLNGLTHSYTKDIDCVVVVPNGTKIAVMSDAGGVPGGTTAVSGISLTFDDAAAANLPDGTQMFSGTYKPTDIDPLAGEIGGVTGIYATTFAGLINLDPQDLNGTWTLHVKDDQANDVGTIANGWSVTITTAINVLAADVVWTNTAAGTHNWSVAANWSPNVVPGSALEQAFITNAGSYTIVVDTSPTLSRLMVGAESGTQTLRIQSTTLTLGQVSANPSPVSRIEANAILELSGGTLAGADTLEVDGTMNWTAGTMQGTGTTRILAGGTLNLSGPTYKLISYGRILENVGTVVWTSTGRLQKEGTGVTIDNHGLFDLQSDSQLILNFGSTPAFNNHPGATLRKSGGTGIFEFGFALNNSATALVEVLSGTLKLSSDGANAGNWRVANSARLEFAGGTFTQTGAMQADAGSSIALASGTCNFESTVSFTGPGILELSGGTLGGTGTLEVDGTMNWTGGTMSGSGTTRILTNATLFLSTTGAKYLSGGRVIENHGNFVWAGGDVQFNGGRIDNSGQLFAGGGLATGVARVSRFTSIAGSSVSNLTQSPNYPNSPNEVRLVTTTDTGQNLGDTYGGLMEFYWTPKVSGSVQFAIAADDNAELWISTDASPANLVHIASEPEWNGHRDFGTPDRRPGCGGNGGLEPCDNVSAPISVTAGTRYLVRGLWKEGSGGDHFAIAVQPAGQPFSLSSPLIPSDEISGWLTESDLTVSVAGGVNAINNLPGGLIRKGGPGRFTINAPLNNAGRLAVNFGAMNLNANGQHSGPVELADYAMLELSAVQDFSASSTLQGTGIFSILAGTSSFAGALSSALTLDVRGGAVNFAGSTVFGAGRILSGSVGGAGQLVFNGVLAWNGGGMTGAGRTVVPAATGILLINAPNGVTLSRTLQIDGTAAWTRGAMAMNGGQIENNGSLHAGGGTIPGLARIHVWRNIAGANVSDLTSQGAYPNSPTETTVSTTADSGLGLGDTYGAVMEFLWTPKFTGPAQFAIAADDRAELWVSSDTNPANVSLLATEPTWSGYRAFGSTVNRPGCNGVGGQETCENVSAPFQVVAGQSYFIRGIWKEHSHLDHMAIAALPAGQPFLDTTPPIPSDEIAAVFPSYDVTGDGIAGSNAFNNNSGASLVKRGANTLAFIASSANVGFNNLGPIDIQSGALRVDAVGIAFPQTSRLNVAPGATLQLHGGNLVSEVLNPANFSPGGRLFLSYRNAPQQIEAMSEHRGFTPAAYLNNFAYGTLELGANAHVTVVDVADNSPGPDVLYVGHLIVPSTATLNLGGLTIIAKSAVVFGAVTNGSLNAAPLSIPLRTPERGDLTGPHQFDVHSFTAEAGDWLRLRVASDNSIDLQVTLLAANGTPLAATNKIGTAQLDFVTASAGTYYIRVEARDGLAKSPYTLTLTPLNSGAAPLTIAVPFESSFTNLAQVDVFTFQANAGETMKIRLSTEEWLEPVLEVFDAQRQLLASAVADVNTVLSVPIPTTGLYTLVVSDDDGFDLAPYQVSLRRPPFITSHPVSTHLALGAQLNLQVAAEGAPPLEYQWRRNGVILPGETGSTLSLADAGPRTAGSYSAVVQNADGATTSLPALVTIEIPTLNFADDFANRPSVTTVSGLVRGGNQQATRQSGEPRHARKPGRHSVWFTWTPPAAGLARVRTTGSSFDTLLACYLGSTLSELTPVAADDDTGGNLTSEIVFLALAGADYLLAVDGAANASGEIILEWSLDTAITNVPTITTFPLSLSIPEGQNAQFVVQATSPLPLIYQWLFKGESITNATNATLLITNTLAVQAGPYSVRVSDDNFEIVTPPRYLEISPLDNALSEDKLEDLLAAVAPSPATQRFRRQFASVSVGSAGTHVLDNFGSSTESYEPSHGDRIGGASRWLAITAIADGFLVIDTLGSAIDTLLAVYTGASILELQHVASDDNSAEDGRASRVQFRARRDVRYLIAVDGVRAEQGNIRINWRFHGPPAFQNEPLDLHVALGATAEFRAGFSGVPAPEIIWHRNGRPIAGVNSGVLTLSSVQFSQAGRYRAVIRNVAGSSFSREAILTVSDSNPRTVRLSSGTAAPGASVTLPLELTSPGDVRRVALSVEFDPALLTLNAINPGAAAAGATLTADLTQAAQGRASLSVELPYGQSFASGTLTLATFSWSVAAQAGVPAASIVLSDRLIPRGLSSAAGTTLAAAYVDAQVTFQAGLEADVAPRSSGDGALSVADWVQVGRFAAGLDIPAPGVEFQKADCAPKSTFGDGIISVADWVQAGRYAAGLDTINPASGPAGP